MDRLNLGDRVVMSSQQCGVPDDFIGEHGTVIAESDTGHYLVSFDPIPDFQVLDWWVEAMLLKKEV